MKVITATPNEIETKIMFQPEGKIIRRNQYEV
jgi:hypothetical protein